MLSRERAPLCRQFGYLLFMDEDPSQRFRYSAMVAGHVTTLRELIKPGFTYERLLVLGQKLPSSL